MVLVSILTMVFIFTYVVALLYVSVVLFKTNRNKEYADRLGFWTKGDVRQIRLYSFIPVMNLICMWFLMEDLFGRSFKDNTPLHKDS